MQRFLKHLGKAFFIGTLIYLVFLLIYYFSGRFDKGFDFARAWEEYYTNMIFSVILYMINAFWFQFILINYKEELFTVKRFFISISGVVF